MGVWVAFVTVDGSNETPFVGVCVAIVAVKGFALFLGGVSGSDIPVVCTGSSGSTSLLEDKLQSKLSLQLRNCSSIWSFS